MQGKKERENDGQAGRRQIGRQAGRQANWQAGRQAGRQIGRQEGSKQGWREFFIALYDKMGANSSSPRWSS